MIILVGLLRDLDFVVSVFPLHDKEDIKLIEHDWFMSKDALFKSQDIRRRIQTINLIIIFSHLDKVRNYFGDKVAFYFAFLECYTKALIPTAILGKKYHRSATLHLLIRSLG